MTQPYVIIEGGSVQNEPSIPVFDFDVLDGDDVGEVVNLLMAINTFLEENNSPVLEERKRAILEWLAENGEGSLLANLEHIRSAYRQGKLGPSWDAGPLGVLGIHGPDRDEDNNEYITVGFTLPHNVYAEIEDGTYGELNAFRVYRDW